jgi:hypothetical protein
MADTAPVFDITQTPDPSEIGLSVWEHSLYLNPSQIPTIGQTFKTTSFALKGRVTQNGFGDYLYSGNAKMDGRMVFYFNKPKSDAEKQTPFRSTKTLGQHSWPPILKFLAFQQDSSFPRTTNTVIKNQTAIVIAPRYYVKEGYIPGARDGTTFIKDEFFAPTPFVIPRYPAPMPTRVSYDILGIKGSFPECLHDEIKIPATKTGTYVIYGDTVNASAGTVGGQIFPATNFTTWRRYVLDDQQSFQENGGGWYRVRITVIPPPEPELIVQGG